MGDFKDEEKQLLASYDQNDVLFRKSNRLIDSKYKSTITELYIQAFALSKVASEGVDTEYGYKVKIMAGEIRKFLPKKVNDGSFYTQLKVAAKALTGRVFGWEDEKTKHFTYGTLVNTVEYQDGEISVYFNNKMKDELTELSTHYTLTSLLEQTHYKSTYALRISELLQRRMFTRKGEPVKEKYVIEFDKNEFYLMIGLVDSNDPAIRKKLEDGKGTPEEYQKAVESCKNTSYSRITDLRNRVIDPSVKEINENQYNNINVELVDYVRAGIGGKVTKIVFYAKIVNDENTTADSQNGKDEEEINGIIAKKNVEKLSEDEKYDFVEKVMNLYFDADMKIKLKEGMLIAKAADYDMGRISNVIEMLSSNGTDIESVVGWSIAALKNNYKKSAKKKASKKSEFNNIIEGEYNIDEIEAILTGEKKKTSDD